MYCSESVKLKPALAASYEMNSNTFLLVVIISLLISLSACNGSSGDSNPKLPPEKSNTCPEQTSDFIVVDAYDGLSGKLPVRDIDNDTLNYTLVAEPLLGSLSIDSLNGTFNYQPDNDQTQRDSVVIEVSDGNCTTSLSPLNFIIDNSLQQTTPILFPDGGAAKVALNHTDGFEGRYTYELYTSPSKGNVTLPVDGSNLIYSAHSGVVGYDSIQYVVSDGTHTSEPITINIEIDSIQLTVPKTLRIPAGETLRIFLDNIVNVPDYSKLNFHFSIDGLIAGDLHLRYWDFIASPDLIGQHTLQVDVENSDGNQVASTTTQLNIYPLPPVNSGTSEILFIGDSLTAGGDYVRATRDTIRGLGYTDLQYIGTVHSSGVDFEGYGGNTWQRYYSTVSDRSPFVYIDTGLDFERYFDTELSGQYPEYVAILLGVNDIAHTDASLLENINEKANTIFATADSFISELQRVVPKVKILISSIPVPNSRESAFIDDYGDVITRENYRNMQHVFVRLQEQQFSNRDDENIYFIPNYLSIDTINDYPDNNALHPISDGYEHMGEMFFNEFMFIYPSN